MKSNKQLNNIVSKQINEDIEKIAKKIHDSQEQVNNTDYFDDFEIIDGIDEEEFK